ncbi:homoserine kinase [Arcanobacterium haemolyticum]|nr:homoserine kinase [Arcanobacterium haemolyticum]
MRIVRSEARVRVPATSGNLGPGFDSMGMAHPLTDEVAVRLVAGSTRVVVEGEGSGVLPSDDSHLIVKAIRRTLDVAGLPQSGIELTCRNSIPQGRGLGSSAAAVVAGIILVRGLVDEPELINDDVALAIATEFEGHPDNAAPAIYGGAVVSWVDEHGAKAVPIPVHPSIRTTLLVPDAELLTETARSVLPPAVPHADAAFNAARTALLTLALEHRPDLLLEATADKLHQDYRAASMPATARAVAALREAGWPAVVSGAGPSVLVFDELDPETARILKEQGFRAIPGGPGAGCQVIS